MTRPIVALLTDFGTRDPYVAAMKGVILSICPEVTLVDLTHDVAPHDVREAARTLAACHGFYPAGAIFVAVVDPGVGSARRALAIDTGDYRLVGPDNGVFGEVLALRPARQVVELRDRRYQRPTVSRTFEGRDRFAPAAAWLARGTALSALGPAVEGIAHMPPPLAVLEPHGIAGEVDAVDRFGNLISNIDRATVATLLRGGPVEIVLGGHLVPRLVDTYADVPPGDTLALFGSSDRLEVAVNGASAAARLGAGVGTAVTVSPRRGL